LLLLQPDTGFTCGRRDLEEIEKLTSLCAGQELEKTTRENGIGALQQN